eukprot:TRINITY_DN7385_c0_g1_i3.p1 TRINITY_DN7385_c0_g1~~TRINITY_DN7385_c0_g1_i3.p1  ORF type:complete len:866 (-),score=165.64 TRINITY_DN7385_c0_g1_i3:118-2715(-)
MRSKSKPSRSLPSSAEDPSIAAQQEQSHDDLDMNQGNNDKSFKTNGSDPDSGNSERKDRRNEFSSRVLDLPWKRSWPFNNSGKGKGMIDSDSDSDSYSYLIQEVAKGKRQRISRVLEEEDIDENLIMKKDELGFNEVPLNSFSGDGEVLEPLNFRLQDGIPKEIWGDLDFNGIDEDEGRVQPDGEKNHPVTVDKGKRPWVEDASLSIGVDSKKLSGEDNSMNDACYTTFRKVRYSKEEKGKGKLVETRKPSIHDVKCNDEKVLGAAMNSMMLKNDVKCDDEEVLEAGMDLMLFIAREEARGSAQRRKEARVQGAQRRKEARVQEAQRREEVRVQEAQRREEEIIQEVQQRRGNFLSIAKHYAHEYAYFDPNKDRNSYDKYTPVRGTEVPVAVAEAGLEDKDCPTGLEDEACSDPFSTALKIVKERARKLSVQSGSPTLDPSKVEPKIEWEPSQDCESRSLDRCAPSLEDICLNILSKHAEAIASLEGVPDYLRSKLSHLLCDSRKMDHRLLGLMVSGSPTEICLKDCSWITEEQFHDIFRGCDIERLQELQLDLCGRCMPDYILCQTLAQSPNSLSALTTISLRGAYRLSDKGLSALVSSAPSLTSVNLSQCQLLTSTGISILAENLGSVLRELYMDDCQNVNVLSILPALKNLKHLEVLSVAGIQNVCDEFVNELIPVRGADMKKLVFSDCGKLTDNSLKIISKNCSGLCAIDLSNLKNLTDVALKQLANGCTSLKVLQLSHNKFSDEGIASFLEVSGKSLTELSLNNVKKVANNTAISLANCCSETLLSLDLSWCRKLMDEALGLIVDKCLSLKILRLFGCTQVTNFFLDGHSNSLVKIIGLSTEPLLEHLHNAHTLPSSLRY